MHTPIHSYPNFWVGRCLFNSQEGWLHEATRILIGAMSGSIDKNQLQLMMRGAMGKQ